MARYEHLPIYKKSFELAVYLERVVSGFARKHKYGLGARLQAGAQQVLCAVIRAQNARGASRAGELSALRIEVEVLKNMLNLAREVRAFKSFGAYRHAAGLAVDIGRQTEGWLGSCKEPGAPESRPTNPSGGRP